MDRSIIRLAAGCAAVAALMGAMALPAGAYYLGYGNGDPGDWDFWTEQNGGPVDKTVVPAKPARHATKVHHDQHRGGHETKHAG